MNIHAEDPSVWPICVHGSLCCAPTSNLPQFQIGAKSIAPNWISISISILDGFRAIVVP